MGDTVVPTIPSPDAADARLVTRLDRWIRQSFILLDALDRRTLTGITPALTTAQYHALAQLACEPSQSLGDLAARLFCDKANASGLMDRLTEQGLATRIRDPKDKRRVSLGLTPAGRDILERATDARASALNRALFPLHVDGLTATDDLLERVVELLQAAVAEAYEQQAGGNGASAPEPVL